MFRYDCYHFGHWQGAVLSNEFFYSDLICKLGNFLETIDEYKKIEFEVDRNFLHADIENQLKNSRGTFGPNHPMSTLAEPAYR